MCGHYARHANPEVMALAFKLGLMPEIKAHYNIASSTQILIVRDDKKKGRVAPTGRVCSSRLKRSTRACRTLALPASRGRVPTRPVGPSC